jgi:hypothetical protein
MPLGQTRTFHGPIDLLCQRESPKRHGKLRAQGGSQNSFFARLTIFGVTSVSRASVLGIFGLRVTVFTTKAMPIANQKLMPLLKAENASKNRPLYL